MDQSAISQLLIVLAAGFGAGLLCKRLRVPLLLGYLVAGMLLGGGGLGLVQAGHELELIAQAGVLLLLFAIGLEFSLDELLRLSRWLSVGGTVQMALTVAPVVGFSIWAGMPWRPAVLLGSAVALSSTVLVYRALSEWGQLDAPHGRRAIGILLAQDVALVPLLLLVPALTGDRLATTGAWLQLAGQAAAFVAGVLLLREAIRRWGAPLLLALRAPELVVLFAVVVVGGAAFAAHALALPVPLGAFAAGLALSGSRLTEQVDALLLPMRETFAAVFFVSLGLLFDPATITREPLLILGGLAAVVLLKWLAGAMALRLTGLAWPAALGMGLGLAQLGEFSFVLVLAGVQADVLTQTDYQRMLSFALGTLLATPLLLRVGLKWAARAPAAARAPQRLPEVPGETPQAVVIGIGLAGGSVASQLEMTGRDVCLVDLSPVNTHRFAAQGFRTVAGDATDEDVLRRAGADRASIIVVCVPHDRIGADIVRAVRRLNASGFVLVRCRYASNARAAQKAGASHVVSEESEVAEAFRRVLERLEKLRLRDS
jgi:CPA2 family monovalent cation:H+ antiporter-2